MVKVSAIIVAAGTGTRFGSPKPFVPLMGQKILYYSLDAFNRHPWIQKIVLVLRDMSENSLLFQRFEKLKAVVPGGERRQDSVFAGFQQLNPDEEDIVLIHDAARPLVSEELIGRIVETTRTKGAAIPGLPVTDTIKKVSRGIVFRTVDRQGLYRIQTPQGFSYEMLHKAYSGNPDGRQPYTDEAALVERQGEDVFLVPGDPKNIKITIPEDLKIAEALIED